MRFRSLFALGLALFPVCFATTAHAEEPLAARGDFSAPPPAAPADLPPPGAKTSVIVTGAAITAVTYGLSLGASFLIEEQDFRGAKQLRIPIAGPWLSLAKTGCPTATPDCSKVTLVVGAILTIFDGVAQAGGLAIIGEGLFLNTSNRKPAARKAEGPTVRAVPFSFEKGGVGLGVVGSF